ncbi:MAG: hypothetical protein A3K77_00620 [Euryarchaeota archaeon RBG_13_31_8]|nr:MAG: hypothetical protein A3K77_00620 [Euryarchaeota archaeon RBG_13_31_8]
MKKYDYLIVGAGLFGSTFAYLMTRAGKKCLVIDKRNHVAGNCHINEMDNIKVHQYGVHIFHTKKKEILDFINNFTELDNYRYKVKAFHQGKLYSFPINLQTIYELYGVLNPELYKTFIKPSVNINLDNLSFEDYCINTIGKQLYDIFIFGYTLKQWGDFPKNLPASIIKRIPLRYTLDDNYYEDNEYQGLPKIGYTNLCLKLLMNADVKLTTDYFEHKQELDELANKIVYTGSLDDLYEKRFGVLEYRYLEHIVSKYELESYQGIAVIHYSDQYIPFTRIIEHKYIGFCRCFGYTIISAERVNSFGSNPCYPKSFGDNIKLYNQYLELSKQDKKLIIGGRLAEYKYMNMDETIESAIQKANGEFKKGSLND